MKKLLSVALIAMMVLSCFSFVTYADENYDFTLSIVADKASYSAGDEMELSIVADKPIKTSSGRINISFNADLVEILLGESDSDIKKFPWGDENIVDGTFLLNWAGSKNYEADEGDVLVYLYLEVKEDIKGVDELNIRWIKDESDNTQSMIKYLDSNKINQTYNVKFESLSVKTVGAELDNEPEVLPMAYANASENDLGETTINGETVNITTNYAVAFGKVAARKADAVKVKAGFLLSRTADNMVITNADLTDYEAINFSSENMFGGLFYGPGLSAGTTYYVMPYVTYSDGVTLYASEAVSFTMPQ